MNRSLSVSDEDAVSDLAFREGITFQEARKRYIDKKYGLWKWMT